MENTNYECIVYTVWYDEKLLKVFNTFHKALVFIVEQVNLNMQGNNELSLDVAVSLYEIIKEEVH
jgi:hypothetical protein